MTLFSLNYDLLLALPALVESGSQIVARRSTKVVSIAFTFLVTVTTMPIYQFIHYGLSLRGFPINCIFVAILAYCLAVGVYGGERGNPR